MNKYLYQLVLVFMSFFLISCTAIASQVDDPANISDYPRIEQFEQGSVLVDFPTIESWPDFRFLNVWLPVEVRLNNDNEP